MSDDFQGEIIRPRPQMLLPLTVSPRGEPDAEMHTGVCLGGNRDTDDAVVFIVLHEGVVAALYTCAAARCQIKVADQSPLDDVDIRTFNLDPIDAPSERTVGPDIFKYADAVYMPSLLFCRPIVVDGADGLTPMVATRGFSNGEPFGFVLHADVVLDMWQCLLRRVTQCRNVSPFNEIMEEINPDFFNEAEQDDT